jgi:ferritin-like metal-binding protein YciE
MAQPGAPCDPSIDELRSADDTESSSALQGQEFDDATIDACLIAAEQYAEHHKMVAYGRFLAWARATGDSEELGLPS